MISAMVVLLPKRGNQAGIADLSAGVAVEAGVVEHDFDPIACSGRGYTYAVFHDGEHFGVGSVELFVAEGAGLARSRKALADFWLPLSPAGAGRGTAGLFGALKALFVELDAGIASGVDHEVEGKAEGFVEVESLLAGKVTFKFFIKAREANLEHAIELLLFGFDNFRDAWGRIDQLRISALHQVADGEDHLIQEWLFLVEQTAVTDSATEDLRQDAVRGLHSRAARRR